MISSDDDDVEPRLKAVENYYFVDDDDSPVSFDVLPFQFNAAEEVPSFKRDVYLRGFADGGLQKVYKQVVAWKLSLDGKSPEVTVLSTEGSWILLLKPRSSYRETIRSVLVTVEMLHFVRRNPTVFQVEMWDHLHGVFGKYEINPSVDDLRNHVRLINLAAERDQAISKSHTLQLFIDENTVQKTDTKAHNTAENIAKVYQNTAELINKVAKNTVEKIDKVGSDDPKVKHPFVANDEARDEIAEEDSKHESCNDDNEEDEEGDLFDSVCAICDNGGELLCCEGSCMRSFHAKIGDGEDSYCATLGYTKAELEAIKNFLCKNCEYKQHQCFVCGVLEPSDGANAKVFPCNNATCGHFYHPKCVAQRLHPNNRNEALQLEKSIVAGFSFTCPIHWCFECKGLEDRTEEPLQFAVCRRCPRSYHRKCLPREISFEDLDNADIITRAWELSNRILIYCLDHDMDLDLGTPSRDHLKFPGIAKPVHSVKKKVKELAKKKRQTNDDLYCGSQPVQISSRRLVTRSSFEQPVSEPVKKKAKSLKRMMHPEESLSVANSPKSPLKEQESLLKTGETPQSSFPIVDSETEERVKKLVEKEISPVTLDDISRRCAIPSTYASSHYQIDKFIAQGKLERAVQAVQAALQKLEHGGTVDDAKAVCEAEVLRQITRWNNKLRVYLAPFIHGMRYTSFGRHFTKKEKLIEIVDKLHWYVQPGDTIVDFSCGLNDFSQFMKEKLDTVGKRCNFKNFDVIQPKNSLSFEKRDWMTVRPKELPHGSKLIIGLNPPFGMKAMLANKFINKALSFKPKLIILIVPKEAERLDQKREPYNLIWEDTGCLSGRSFYLPGSLDVTDKLMDQWNVSPPPLYLWSRPDWTQKHMKIAEEHGHTTLRGVSHSKQMDYLLDDIQRQNHGELPYKNKKYGEDKNSHMTESLNFVVGKPERVNGLPPETHVEEPYEELKAAGGTLLENRSGIHFGETAAHSEYRFDVYNDKTKETELSNCCRLERTGDGMKADSDMSISPSDSRNTQYKSRCDSPHMTHYFSSERMAHQDIYMKNLLPEPCTSSLDNVPCEDYVTNVAEYGVASVEKHLAFSTSSVGAGLRRHIPSPDLDELTGEYAGVANSNFNAAESGGTSSSFYRSHNIQENYGMESISPVSRKAVTPAADIRAQIRMYGGHTGDGHPQTAMNPPATDIRTQIRMYGQQGIDAFEYPVFSEPHNAKTSSYGISSLVGRSAMDRYTPCLHETNYAAGTYTIPDNRKDMTPDPVGFGSRQQYPYPHPGFPSGWPG